MKRQYLYVYRTRRPSGWGTHNGYTGRTNHPRLRDAQHAATKRWYPLVRYRVLIPLGPCPVFVAAALEWLLIKVTMPVYNVQHNRWNPRRIRPWDVRGTVGPWAKVKDVITLAPVLGMVALALYLWS